jgi:hypothetical protein
VEERKTEQIKAIYVNSFRFDDGAHFSMTAQA